MLVLALAPATALAGFIFDVGITKSHAGNFTVGQPGTFTITLHNFGSQSTGSDTLTVTDALPNGLTYASDTGSGASMPCTVSGQTVTCSGHPNIANGADLSFTITVSVGPAAVPSVQNTATFSDAANADSNPNNNSSTDTVTVNAAPSPSPSPSPSPLPSPSLSPSPSASASPTASASASPAGGTGPVALADTGGRSRNGAALLPAALLLALGIGAAAAGVAARRRAG
jgi:uncharacterized repeat protein (TIGR01451 family)